MDLHEADAEAPPTRQGPGSPRVRSPEKVEVVDYLYPPTRHTMLPQRLYIAPFAFHAVFDTVHRPACGHTMKHDWSLHTGGEAAVPAGPSISDCKQQSGSQGFEMTCEGRGACVGGSPGH